MHSIQQAAWGVALGVFLAVSGALRAAELPHILVMLVDDMGYGDPGCYNPASKISTPNIDRLAAEGLRFTDAHAPGAVCHPSRYGLLTGRYPFRTDVSVWPRQPLIEKNRITLASLLRSRGYRTAMIGKWHLGFHEQGYDQPLAGGPIEVGFDTFFGIRASTDIPPYFYIRGDRAVVPPTSTIAASRSPDWSPIQGEFWREGGIAPDLALKDVLPRFTQEAVDVITAHAAGKPRKPLMLYVALPAPHTPWLPSVEFRGTSRAGLYGDFAAMTDAMIGRILEALNLAGMKENTLVVFASDNGPTWYPADGQRTGHDSAGGWRGMKGDAWEAGHRVPLIMRWPGRIKAATVTRQTVCLTDLLATFGSLVSARLPEDSGEDSFDLRPLILGRHPESRPIRGPVVTVSSAGFTAIRSGPWKLIDGLGSGGFSPPSRIQPAIGGATGQLYNLKDDPTESTNVWQQHLDVVERLTAELTRIRESKRSRP
ncbi:MAG: arylsulfatase [Verrucomicrobiales bacterium]|nr:arylsulfatase [Verrucomicrobiales bacterium]